MKAPHWTIISAIASLAVMTWMFGFAFAVTLLAGLALHEAGHAFAFRFYGMPVKNMIFIPMFGAVVESEGTFTCAGDRFVVALMGPAFGFASVIGGFVLAGVTGNEAIGRASALLALLNLANMLPAMPLDGGHMFETLVQGVPFRARMMLLALALLASAAVADLAFSRLFAAIVLALGAYELVFRFAPASRRLRAMDARETVVAASRYAMLAMLLLASTAARADDPTNCPNFPATNDEPDREVSATCRIIGTNADGTPMRDPEDCLVIMQGHGRFYVKRFGTTLASDCVDLPTLEHTDGDLADASIHCNHGAARVSVTMVGTGRTIGPIDVLHETVDTGQGAFLTSPDGRHVSYVSHRPTGWYLVVDGNDFRIRGPVTTFWSFRYSSLGDQIAIRYEAGDQDVTVVEPTIPSLSLIP